MFMIILYNRYRFQELNTSLSNTNNIEYWISKSQLNVRVSFTNIKFTKTKNIIVKDSMKIV